MFGLHPKLEAALSDAGLTEPTPIQAKAIPLAMNGDDVLGLAQTGTGKTLAFGLPLLDHVLAHPGKPAPRCVKALVLAPTRELVNQIADNLRGFASQTKVSVQTVVGGQPIRRQINRLERGCDILVATPGRLIDLMERKAVDLSTAGALVLDEADQMLDMGFIHALRQIAPALGTPRQTMLFSATMPKQMEELSKAYLENPRRVQVAPPGKAADKVTQSLHFIEKPGKTAKLREILSQDLDALTLVFARTKHGAERLMKDLSEQGFDAASVHGNKSQGQRDRAIKAFREGRIKVLVATDVAARGIDIPGVAYVVNYDLPEVPDNYVHRIGRTARAGREGQAISFCSAEEVGYLRQIQRVMKMSIPVASGEEPEAIDPPKRGRGGRKFGGPQRGASQPRGDGDQANGQPKRRGKSGGFKKNGPGKPANRARRPRRPRAAA